MLDTQQNTSGWSERRSSVAAAQIASRHRRTLCDKAEEEVVSSVPFLPTFCPLSIFLQLFLPPLILTVQTAQLQTDATRRVRCDHGVWHRLLVPVWTVCISAVYLCHLSLTFVWVTAQALQEIYVPAVPWGWIKGLGLALSVVCWRLFQHVSESPYLSRALTSLNAVTEFLTAEPHSSSVTRVIGDRLGIRMGNSFIPNYLSDSPAKGVGWESDSLDPI